MKHVRCLLLALPLAGLILLAACADAPGPSRGRSASTTAHIDDDVFFATSPGQAAGMQALYQGQFVVRDECVLIGRSGSYSVPVWPDGFTLATDGSGDFTVLDGHGTTIAIEGKRFQMAGGYTAEFEPKNKVEPRQDQLDRVTEWLGYPIPERCLGRDVYGVWLVGETIPAGSAF